MTLESQLVRDEGEVLHAYQDSLGYWTIGVGHLIDKRKGGQIPREVSRLLLALDIQKAEDLLDKYLPWTKKLDPIRRAVLVNMAFNLGTNLLGFTRTLSLVQAGRYDEAANEMLKSKWASQVGARAQRLAQQMREGKEIV